MRSMTKSADLCGGKSSKTCPEFISGWKKNGIKWQMVVVSALLAVLPSLFTTLAYSDAPKISGFIDTTYTYDFNSPASRRTAMRTFDRKTDVFLLNAAQVNIEGSKDGIGYYAELAFGTDPSVYKAAGTGIDGGLPTPPSTVAYNFELQEAFLTYKCPQVPVMLKAGKFVTFNGIEVIESKDNPTVTRGYLFGMAEPFTHVGAVVGYEFPKYVDIWVGLVNGWDLHTDNNLGKTLAWKVGVKVSDRIWGSFSGYRGAEKPNNAIDQRTSFDATWFVKPVEMLTLGLQFNAGEEEKTSINMVNAGAAGHWYGFGIQPKVDFTKMFFLGARYEWFSDLDGARTAVSQIGQNITLTPGVNLTENLMFRLEYRYDWVSRPNLVYETSDGAFSKGETSAIATELIYKF